ncbi:hypothetical protein IM697_27110 [Streptomyces ferrugineus]|uniref:Copper chaperone PCu(A)C n=1 Tax=Streptomyces ferrugineus TaxID=1413221 RepID=A0A7M2SF77_9ACTN|nr:hypothetical protein [Streptomyces ferrugineus]QOV33851.1 hypothetical protein IM697_27110 [Streptomyces ferrugineus]
MAVNNQRGRTVLAAASAAALIALTAGCTNPSSTASAPETAGGTTALGRAEVRAPGVDLTVTHAVAHLNHAGDGTLTMEVRNEDGVPEHLGMVATPGGGRGTLVGGRSDEGNGALSVAGIMVQSGTTVTFGGSGPRVMLRHVQGVTAHHTLPISLQFGVAGLVRLQARVAAV